MSRELRRNASTRSNELAYRASTAQWHAERRASRPKVSKLAANDRLRDYVADRLSGQIARPDGEAVAGPEVAFVGRRHGCRADRRWAKSWSPEQISNRLRVDFPHDESMRIYEDLFEQDGELCLPFLQLPFQFPERIRNARIPRKPRPRCVDGEPGWGDLRVWRRWCCCSGLVVSGSQQRRHHAQRSNGGGDPPSPPDAVPVTVRVLEVCSVHVYEYMLI